MKQMKSAPQPIKANRSTDIWRILVMDDNPSLRYIYIQALHEAGYEAYPAATIQEARDLLATYDFDILISDTHLVDRDHGVRLLREQLRTFAKSDTKIIMMSCHTEYQPICEGMGADIFIEKPIAADRLVALVNRLMKQRLHSNDNVTLSSS